MNDNDRAKGGAGRAKSEIERGAGGSSGSKNNSI